MKKAMIVLAALIALLLHSCTTKPSQTMETGLNFRFVADDTGAYYVTDGQVVYVPFAGRLMGQTVVLEGMENITAICVEQNSIGVIDTLGRYHTTAEIQPSQAEMFGQDGDLSAGIAQFIQIAREFDSIGNISSFYSAYPQEGVFVHKDGTVTAIGNYTEEQKKEIAGWKNVKQAAGSGEELIALTEEGAILSLSGLYNAETISKWTDIKVLYGEFSTCVYALSNDGQVQGMGYYYDNSDWSLNDVENWEDIVYIAPAFDFVVGLKSDGTVVAAGKNDYGQCQVSGWKNIVAIDTVNCSPHQGRTKCTVGLDADGNILIAGILHGQHYSGIYLECANVDMFR